MSKILFLHIPKTAGQSVHHFFETSFKKDLICPARVNEQLKDYNIKDLEKYDIFSGHMDWDKLEKIQGDKFTFTILRNPKDRILSFYFYLRKQAENLPKDKLNLPQHQAMKAALELSPDDYFVNPSNLRTFLDNHYDNFYMYYFAGKNYHARSILLKQLENKFFDSKLDILTLAINNMKKLNKVYDITNWEDLYKDLKNINSDLILPNNNIHVNKGDGKDNSSREDELKKLGATSLTFNRINDFCLYDNIIYSHFKELYND